MNADITYQNYFQRQTILPEFGKIAQQKLANANSVIVGCGGLGSSVAVYLAASGVGTIHLVDFDVISISNLHRQVFYKTHDVGKPKALILAEHIRQLTPFTKVTTSTNAVTKTTVLDIIKTADIVLDCTDSLPIKYLLNDACVLLDKPLIYGSLYKFDGYVASFNSAQKNGEFTANLRDIFPEMARNIPNCSEVGTLNGIVGIIGNFQANEAIKLLTNIGKPISNELLLYNSLENTQHKIKIKKTVSKQQIAKIFKDETYQVISCQTQEETLLISAKALKEKIALQKPLHIVSVVENQNTIIPFKVTKKMKMSQFKDWLEKTNLFSEKATTIIVCNKGISSYEATLLATKKFPKASILSLQNGIEKF